MLSLATEWVAPLVPVIDHICRKAEVTWSAVIILPLAFIKRHLRTGRKRWERQVCVCAHILVHIPMYVCTEKIIMECDWYAKNSFWNGANLRPGKDPTITQPSGPHHSDAVIEVETDGMRCLGTCRDTCRTVTEHWPAAYSPVFSPPCADSVAPAPSVLWAGSAGVTDVPVVFSVPC